MKIWNCILDSKNVRFYEFLKFSLKSLSFSAPLNFWQCLCLIFDKNNWWDLIFWRTNNLCLFHTSTSLQNLRREIKNTILDKLTKRCNHYDIFLALSNDALYYVLINSYHCYAFSFFSYLDCVVCCVWNREAHPLGPALIMFIGCFFFAFLTSYHQCSYSQINSASQTGKSVIYLVNPLIQIHL